jgi:tetratricopeptide (TPR) repeat protein
VVCVLAALGTKEASAADPPELRKAREHYRLGREAYAAERFDDAYREFEAGYRLSNRPLFLLNMGHARRRGGNPAEARALYRRFLFLQPDSPYTAEVEALLAQLEEPKPPPPVVMPAPSPVVRVAPVPLPPPMVQAAPPPSPTRTRWWLWAGAGGAVVAAVVVGVLARGGDSYTRQGSLGTLGAP